jgi:hypothetical protein
MRLPVMPARQHDAACMDSPVGIPGELERAAWSSIALSMMFAFTWSPGIVKSRSLHIEGWDINYLEDAQRSDNCELCSAKSIKFKV